MLKYDKAKDHFVLVTGFAIPTESYLSREDVLKLVAEAADALVVRGRHVPPPPPEPDPATTQAGRTHTTPKP